MLLLLCLWQRVSRRDGRRFARHFSVLSPRPLFLLIGDFGADFQRAKSLVESVPEYYLYYKMLRNYF